MKIYVVGFGSGSSKHITEEAKKALEESDIIIGYDLYIDLIKKFVDEKVFLSTPMKKEVDRCKIAIDKALEGNTVSMISSGDAGVYGMAGVIHEVAMGHPELEIIVIPGITAALTGAAILGAPLIHDFVVISLSDLLTPWSKIEKRVEASANADFVICIYNPGSKKRRDYLSKACDLILKHQSGNIPVGIIKNIGRDGEEHEILTLKELRDREVDMFTTVIIGNSQTQIINGKMVTPRGYKII